MKAIDEDAEIIEITERIAAIDRSTEGIRAAGREKAQQFALTDEQRKAAQLEAIALGRTPPPDLLPEPDGTPDALHGLNAERRALTKALERRLGELLPAIEAEGAELIEGIKEGRAAAVQMLDDGTVEITAVMRSIARARTARALADPNSVARPHPGDRTKTRYSPADTYEVLIGRLDPLALEPLRRATVPVVIEKVTEPEPKPRANNVGAFGTPPKPPPGRPREDFL